MESIIYHLLFGILNAVVGMGIYLFGRHERKKKTMPEYHVDCIKALAILRMNYDKKDGAYSHWIYDSLTYAIERISKIDHVNTYIGKERIPPIENNQEGEAK